MRNTIIRFLLACFFLSSSQVVLAEDDEVSIVGGVAYNLKNEDFKVGNKPFKPEFTTLEWSVIAAYKSSYVKFSFDQSIKDHVLIDKSPNDGGGLSNEPFFFSREDIGITVGYSVLDNVSLFVGYTRGETSVVSTGGFRSQEDIGFGADDYLVNIQAKVLEQGPFIGASYSYYLRDSGSFSFSAAYAQLDGEFAFKNSFTSLTDGSVVIEELLLKGDASGFSFSIVWTDQFSEDMLYNIGLKTTRYEFDAPLAPNGDDFDFNDNYEIFSIGFSKFF